MLLGVAWAAVAGYEAFNSAPLSLRLYEYQEPEQAPPSILLLLPRCSPLLPCCFFVALSKAAVLPVPDENGNHQS